MTPDQHLEQWLLSRHSKDAVQACLAAGIPLEDAVLRTLLGHAADPFIEQAQINRLMRRTGT